VAQHLQAIVFDFDGVIANSEPLHLQAFQHALSEEGIALTPTEYYTRYLGFDDVGVFEAVARDRQVAMSARHVAALVTSKGTIMQTMIRDGAVLFAGAKEFIGAAAAEVPIAIASGALRHEIDEIVGGAGLGKLFPVIVASGDTPESKPSPAPYLLAFERLKAVTGKPLEPHRCVAIEDSRWGIESARGAGLRCVGVTTSYPAHELKRAELVAEGLHSLTIPLLDRLCSSPQ
jgi:beta-phosphoglucomutase